MMLNTKKGVKNKETAVKKVLEAADTARNKTEKEKEEVSKRNELLSGFKGYLKKMTSTRFSIFRMLTCVNTSVFIFRRGLSI